MARHTRRTASASMLNGLDLSRLRRPPPRGDRRVPPAACHRFPTMRRSSPGVFRLAEEKQPLTFLACRRVPYARRCPDAVVAIAGIGPLEPEMRDYARGARLCSIHVRFLGRLEVM